jgi:energy-coupling factor transport system permease protein
MDWLRQMPIGQYVPGDGADADRCWLRRLDPRLKLAWTIAFLVTPILAGPLWRLALVALLLLLTAASGLPLRLWGRGVGLLLALALAVGVLAAVLPSGSLPPLALQRPPAELRLQGGPPQSPAPERLGQPWELVRLGPLQITQRSAELGINGATLLFTVVHSANLLLLTTAPEQLVWAISWALAPLARLGWPVERLGFTLLLALRFVPLVQEELQNLLRALATRAVVFKRLGWKGGLALALAVGERLLANVLLRAEQGAEALLARGGHWIEPSRLHQGAAAAAGANGLAVAALLLLGVLRWKVGDL